MTNADCLITSNKYLPFLTLLSLLPLSAFADSPGWRGDGDGIAEGSGYPVTWAEDENVTWRVRLSGHGHAAPVISGDAVIVVSANADGTERSILCFERDDGDLRWRQTFETDEPEPTHRRNGYASATPVADGETVYAWLGSAGVVALDLDDGAVRWQRELEPTDHPWGPAAGLRLFKDLLIVHHGPGESARLLALRTATGETVWRRPVAAADAADAEGAASLATPIVRESSVGGHELIVALPGRLAAFNPMTGRPYWHCTGLGPRVIASPMPGREHLAAVDVDGAVVTTRLPGVQRGDVTASHRMWHRSADAAAAPQVATGVIVGEHLFLADAEGELACIVIETGEVRWREDVGSGVHSSLVAAEGRLYLADREGRVHVLRADGRFEKLRTNTLIEGDAITATPAFSRGQIFLRTATHLYGIGVEN